MLNLQFSDRLEFSFPQVHADARLVVTFRRTLRIPDDGRQYDLPPGLGNFPLVNVEGEVAAKLGDRLAKRGGVALPMYQSEAAWLAFEPHRASGRGSAYPFAIKVAAGKRSAVTAKPYQDGLQQGDYCVAPKQLWLDGFATGPGVVRQFVAAPLGMGFTVEEQLDGKAEFGGLQLEVYPMRADEYERRFPVRPAPVTRGATRGGGLESFGGTRMLSVQSMGMAAGGTMKQQVFADEFGLSAWDASAHDSVFVHLLNSLAWQAVTGQAPPTAPRSAADYTRYNLPWFSHYADGPVLGGGGETGKVQSATQLAEGKGFGVLPENESCEPTNVVAIPPAPVGNVPSGTW
ncbi:MAG: hypothetical protein MUF34_20075 [Polyangiaceae bacterium]|jgi:hypothetical protein|nr:hypothetical protein [Polyangiaceae bacterium]